MQNLFYKFKKIIIYVIIIFIAVKCFKIVFLNSSIQTFSENESYLVAYKKFNYGDYTTVKLLHTDTGEVENLPLDIYLYGVVASEMPASFETEALKAQAVVARTYTIYQIKNGNKHADSRGRHL